MLTAFIEEHKLGEGFIETAQKWFIPLAEDIHSHHKGAKQPFFVGVNGCQGSGKSTLTQFLQTYLKETHQLNVVALSLDDFYLSQSERTALSIKIHPMFKTRGVPGTHNMKLAEQVLLNIKHNNYPVVFPRFDKSTDNPLPQSQWPQLLSPVDVVIFEGWCWGVNSQSLSALQSPVNQLESDEDSLGVWRQYVDRQLQQVYQPLYQLMDFWLMLKAPSFDCVYAWRLEQEQKLAQAVPEGDAPGVMTPEQILRFIQFYQRLTEHALKTVPAVCDTVFELDDKRRIQRCVKKANA